MWKWSKFWWKYENNSKLQENSKFKKVEKTSGFWWKLSNLSKIEENQNFNKVKEQTNLDEKFEK